MKKTLTALAVTSAFVAASAGAAHAGPTSSFTDAAGDATFVMGGAGGIAPDTQAATDLLAFDVTPAAKSMTITWTLAKVYPQGGIGDGEFVQSFVAGFVPAKGKGVMINATNDASKPFEVLGTKKKAPKCKRAKVSFTDTTATVKFPYKCVPGWKKGTKFAGVGAVIYTAQEDGLYTDDAKFQQPIVLG